MIRNLLFVLVFLLGAIGAYTSDYIGSRLISGTFHRCVYDHKEPPYRVSMCAIERYPFQFNLGYALISNPVDYIIHDGMGVPR